MGSKMRHSAFSVFRIEPSHLFFHTPKVGLALAPDPGPANSLRTACGNAGLHPKRDRALQLATTAPVVIAPAATATVRKSRHGRGDAGTRGSAAVLFFHSGQTFLTWQGRIDLNGERYRIYRSNAPIDTSNLGQAQFLAQTGKDSAQFYANRFTDQGLGTAPDRPLYHPKGRARWRRTWGCWSGPWDWRILAGKPRDNQREPAITR